MKRMFQALQGRRCRWVSESMESENAKHVLRASSGREMTIWTSLERKQVTRFELSVSHIFAAVGIKGTSIPGETTTRRSEYNGPALRMLGS